MLSVSYKTVRKLVVLFVGLSILLVGIAMIILPGPAIVVIPLGLAVLATEFAWAARLLKKMKHEAVSLKNKLNFRQTKAADLNSHETKNQDT